MLLFLIDLINIENLRISFCFFYSFSFLILSFFVVELHHIWLKYAFIVCTNSRKTPYDWIKNVMNKKLMINTYLYSQENLV